MSITYIDLCMMMSIEQTKSQMVNEPFDSKYFHFFVFNHKNKQISSCRMSLACLQFVIE